MKNSEVLMDIRPTTKLHIWGRASGKTTECVRILKEDKNAWCIVPNVAMKRNYPPDVQRRVVSVRENTFQDIPMGNRVIIDNIDCMGNITDEVWMAVYSRYRVTDIFKSPTNFLDWVTVQGSVDVKLNNEWQKRSRQLVRFPWH